LLLLTAIVVGLYWLNRPAPDQVSGLTSQFTDYFDGMNTLLAGVTDADSAQAALPQLQEMDTRLDSLGELLQGLPEASRPVVTQIVESSLGKLQEERQRIAQIPVVGNLLESILGQIFDKLSALVQG
jgi:hypothetical protein